MIVIESSKKFKGKSKLWDMTKEYIENTMNEGGMKVRVSEVIDMTSSSGTKDMSHIGWVDSNIKKISRSLQTWVATQKWKF